MSRDNWEPVWAEIGRGAVITFVATVTIIALINAGSCMADANRTNVILSNGRPCWCSNNENEWHQTPTPDGGTR